MKKVLFVFMAILVLAACNKPDNAMQCGAFDVSFTMDANGTTMDAVINGDPVTLQNVISGSGARYAGVLNDTDVVLWGKGHNWILILNDGDAISCK